MSSAGSGKPGAARRRWVRVGRSGLHGRGLFAVRDIPADTLVIEYVGERITKAEAERREAERVARRAADDGDGCVYIFELNSRYDIDGDVPWNTARLANHSCSPNCETRDVRGRIWIAATHDIRAGEEITYDYGFDMTDWRDHPCRCGAKDCAGFIVKRNLRWRIRKKLAEERAARRKPAARKVR